MDPITIAIGAFVLVFILLALRVPIAFSMAGVATLAIFLIYATRTGDWTPSRAIAPTAAVIQSNFFELIHSYDLSMIPLFLALGNVAYYAGITTRIYDAAAVVLRGVPGGLAVASILGCGGFSAISGSSIACASTMGRICVPEMLRLGYDRRLAASSVAMGGTLGSLIPPSILFILYGIFTETSVSKLFIAGIIPGLVSLVGMVLTVVIWVSFNPALAPRAKTGAVSILAALIKTWPALVLFVVIIGGIYGGIFTATEAAAVSLVLTIVIGFFQRTLTLGQTWQSICEALIQSAAIFAIAAAAKILVALVALSGVAHVVTDWVTAAQLSWIGMILTVAAIYLVLGMFLDPIGTMVLTLPFFIPLVSSYDMDLIWFGVVVVKLLEIGLVTPPVGLNVFVVGNVAKSVPIASIFSGVARFLVLDVVVLLMIIFIPALSIWLPAAVQ
ncbi:MAG: TRAP transporter large permease [Paracoccus denitrificans]|nr:MAG: TRAP transporter large permease [Paracoccus denitrificans]PZO84270.1 MAG: TRAP transporter large permease [Paracoccus denitrificans]